MNKLITVLVFLVVHTSEAQIPANEEATDALKNYGSLLVNYPLDEIYNKPTNEEIRIISQLKNNYFVDYKVAGQYVYVTKKINLDEFVSYTDQAKRRYMIAAGVIEPIAVTQVKFHQTMRNAYIFSCNFKVVNQSKIGKYLNRYKEGEIISANVEFEQTSNGWSMINSGPDSYLISSLNNCQYGRTATNNVERTEMISDANGGFYSDLKNNLIGTWRGKMGTIILDQSDNFQILEGDKIKTGTYELKIFRDLYGILTNAHITFNFSNEKPKKYSIKPSLSDYQSKIYIGDTFGWSSKPYTRY